MIILMVYTVVAFICFICAKSVGFSFKASFLFGAFWLFVIIFATSDIGKNIYEIMDREADKLAERENL